MIVTIHELLPASRTFETAQFKSGSHTGHVVERFTSIRSWRALALAVSSSSGMWSPVRKYISSGVCPRKAEALLVD